MLVYSSSSYVPKAPGGHGYEHYTRDAICGNCGKVIGNQIKFTDEEGFYFYTREKNEYIYCPYCGKELKRGED